MPSTAAAIFAIARSLLPVVAKNGGRPAGFWNASSVENAVFLPTTSE